MHEGICMYVDNYVCVYELNILMLILLEMRRRGTQYTRTYDALLYYYPQSL